MRIFDDSASFALPSPRDSARPGCPQTQDSVAQLHGQQLCSFKLRRFGWAGAVLWVMWACLALSEGHAAEQGAPRKQRPSRARRERLFAVDIHSAAPGPLIESLKPARGDMALA